MTHSLYNIAGLEQRLYFAVSSFQEEPTTDRIAEGISCLLQKVGEAEKTVFLQELCNHRGISYQWLREGHGPFYQKQLTEELLQLSSRHQLVHRAVKSILSCSETLWYRLLELSKQHRINPLLLEYERLVSNLNMAVISGVVSEQIGDRLEALYDSSFARVAYRLGILEECRERLHSGS